MTLMDRVCACLPGLAADDVAATTAKFKPRSSFRPLTDMVSGGP